MIGKDFKYKKIENFIEPNLIKILETYTNMRHRLNFGDYGNYEKNYK